MLKNNDFIDKLRTSGLRPTKQRLKICEALFNREKTFHFTIKVLDTDGVIGDFHGDAAMGFWGWPLQQQD